MVLKDYHDVEENFGIGFDAEKFILALQTGLILKDDFNDFLVSIAVLTQRIDGGEKRVLPDRECGVLVDCS